MGEKYQSVASYTYLNWKLKLQPRHVPSLGVKPATFHFVGGCPANWTTPVRAYSLCFKIYFVKYTCFYPRYFIISVCMKKNVHLCTFSPCVSFILRCRQHIHIYVSYFLIYSPTLCLFIGNLSHLHLR